MRRCDQTRLRLKGGPRGVASVGGPGNLLSGLARNGVVHREDQRLGGVPQGVDLPAHLIEDGLGPDAGLGVEVVVLGPVLELSAEDGDQGGDGVSSRADELSDEMLAQSFPGLR